MGKAAKIPLMLNLLYLIHALAFEQFSWVRINYNHLKVLFNKMFSNIDSSSPIIFQLSIKISRRQVWFSDETTAIKCPLKYPLENTPRYKNFNEKISLFVAVVLAWGSPLIALTWLQTNKIPTNDPTNIKIFFKISINEIFVFSEFFDLAFFFSFFAIFKIQWCNVWTWQKWWEEVEDPTSTLFLHQKRENYFLFFFN